MRESSKHKLQASILGGITLIALALLAWWQPAFAALAAVGALLAASAGWLWQRGAKFDVTNTTDAANRPKHQSPDVNRNPATAPRADENNRAHSADELLAATMESMREAMIVVDDNLRVKITNRAARTLFAPQGEILNQRLSELTRNPQINNAFRGALEQRARAEVKVETLDVDKRSYDLRVAPLSYGNATPTGVIGVFFDITKLERLERVRQEFLSNVSHELRTPLTSIIAFVETLEDGALEDGENNRRFLEIIRRNATRMHTLLDDILELATIEAGTVKLDLTPVRAAQLTGDIFAALAQRAAERNIELHNEVPAETMIFADARRLEQMLTNLIDNAIKFNRAGGTVTVGCETNGARARLQVSDTGEGIPAEHLPRIFERFYRVDRARSREMGGTGLGLAIVKHLARAHGGETSVQSVAGQGTTFTIELPVKKSD